VASKYPNISSNPKAKVQQKQYGASVLAQGKMGRGGPNMYAQMGDAGQETSGVNAERDPVMQAYKKVKDGANNGG
jgi:hypothetical protein